MLAAAWACAYAGLRGIGCGWRRLDGNGHFAGGFPECLRVPSGFRGTIGARPTTKHPTGSVGGAVSDSCVDGERGHARVSEPGIVAGASSCPS